MRLEHGLEEFLLDCEIRSLSAKTIKGYRNASLGLINYLQKTCGVTEVEDVLHQYIKKFFLELQKGGRKASYLNGLHKAYRAWFHFLKKEEYITRNPMDAVAWAKEEKTVIQTFKPEEVKRMIEVYSGQSYLEIRNKTILCMLLDTGIRCSELCHLKLSDVGETTFKIYGKGKKERFVAKSPFMAKLLLRYLRCRESYFAVKAVPDTLFLSRTGRTLTVEAVERVVRTAGERAKVRKSIRCSPHTCRHYFSQAQLKNGNDVYSLSRLLGHSSIKTTNRYLLGMEDEEIVRESMKRSPLMNL